MNLFRNLKLRTKLLMMLLLPVVGLIFYMSQDINRLQKVAKETKQLTELIYIIKGLSNIVHETQVERGLTSGYIGSNGMLYGKELVEQRKKSDEQFIELSKITKKLDLNKYGNRIDEEYIRVFSIVKELPDIRSRVDNKSISAPDAIKYYNIMNDNLLRLIEPISLVSYDKTMLNSIKSYLLFLLTKERVGIERASLNNAFSASKFNPGIFATFASVVAEQKLLMKEYEYFATKEQQDYVKSKMQGNIFDEVERMRAVAFERYSTGNFEIDPKYWFSTITGKIETMKSVENYLIDVLIKNINNQKQSAESGFIYSIVFSALLIVLAGLFGIIISNDIARNIKKVSSTSFDLAQGEGNLTIRLDSTAKDEIGEMSSYFNMFLNKVQNIVKEIRGVSESLDVSSHDMERAASGVAAISEETSSKVTVVSSAVEEMSVSISQSGKTLEETANNVIIVASAVEEMSVTISNLAKASENAAVEVNNSIKLVSDISEKINDVSQSAGIVTREMSDVVAAVKNVNASINDVSKQCSTSIIIASDAGKKASETDQIIQKLNKSSKLIGKIVGVISDIADQTNMLALNATIEAAGAGEAGKGFAVVANEVKELAKKTAESTDEISQQIEDMQGNMTDAVNAVANIIEVIKEITKITKAITESVTKQSNNAENITNSATNAAEKINNITKDIALISKNASMVTKSSEESGRRVEEIAKSTGELSTAADEVAMNTERISVSIGDISRASVETGKGTNEISRSIREIDIASNEVAKSSALTNQSAQDLFELSKKLNQLVNQFKLDEENKIKGISKV